MQELELYHSELRDYLEFLDINYDVMAHDTPEFDTLYIIFEQALASEGVNMDRDVEQSIKFEIPDDIVKACLDWLDYHDREDEGLSEVGSLLYDSLMWATFSEDMEVGGEG